MKTLRWVLAGLLLGAGPATAAVCTTGTLSDYIALGSSGCTIDSVVYSGFSEVTPLNPAATAILPSSVSLTPLSGVGSQGFALSSLTPISAGPGELLELWFGFGASAGSGTALTGSSLSLGDSTVVPDGAITIIEDICPDGSFSSPSVGCSTTPVVLIVFDTGDDSSLSESATFGPSSFFDVFFDLTIDGGPTGTATLGPSLGEIRTASSGAAVPEPSTWMLLALALLAAACRRHLAAVQPALREIAAPSPHRVCG